MPERKRSSEKPEVKTISYVTLGPTKLEATIAAKDMKSAQEAIEIIQQETGVENLHVEYLGKDGSGRQSTAKDFAAPNYDSPMCQWEPRGFGKKPYFIPPNVKPGNA